MEIKVDAEQVNKVVSEAIINSVIGDRLRKSIEEQVKNIDRYIDNPIKAVIDQHVKDAITFLVVNEYLPQIREKVKAQLADEVVEKLTSQALERLLRGY